MNNSSSPSEDQDKQIVHQRLVADKNRLLRLRVKEKEIKLFASIGK